MPYFSTFWSRIFIDSLDKLGELNSGLGWDFTHNCIVCAGGAKGGERR